MMVAVSFSPNGALMIVHSKATGPPNNEYILIMQSNDGSLVSLRSYPYNSNYERYKRNLLLDSNSFGYVAANLAG